MPENKLEILKKIMSCLKANKFNKIKNKYILKIYTKLLENNKQKQACLTAYSDNIENTKKCLEELSTLANCKNFFDSAKIEQIQEFEFDIDTIKIIYQKK